MKALPTTAATTEGPAAETGAFTAADRLTGEVCSGNPSHARTTQVLVRRSRC